MITGYTFYSPTLDIDLLSIPPQDFAIQLTLLDLPVFKSIKAEELTSLEWNGPFKYSYAPNVVAFTKRFNIITFWVIEEILTSSKFNLIH